MKKKYISILLIFVFLVTGCTGPLAENTSSESSSEISSSESDSKKSEKESKSSSSSSSQKVSSTTKDSSATKGSSTTKDSSASKSSSTTKDTSSPSPSTTEKSSSPNEPIVDSTISQQPTGSTIDPNTQTTLPNTSSEVITSGIITMYSTQNEYSLDADVIQITVSNNTSEESGYGLDYKIEHFNGNTWETIPLDFAVPEIYVILNAREVRTETISLHRDQYVYTPGRYRVVKTIGQSQFNAEFSLIEQTPLPEDPAQTQPEHSITMTMKQQKYPVNSESVQVVFANNTHDESGYGLDYMVEYFNGSTWETVPLNFAIITIYVILNPTESKTETFSLFQDQYDYVPGQYRIVKPFSPNNLVAEFWLE